MAGRLAIPVALSAVMLVAAGVVLFGESGAQPKSQSPPASRTQPPVRHPARNSAPARCRTHAVLVRANTVTQIAKRRYDHEHFGVAVHDALRRVARDPALLRALSRGSNGSALAEANRQLVLHTVRIRIVSGSRVLVDANPSSFAVGGAKGVLRGPGAKSLGRAEVTVQDVIGFIKLVHKYHPGDVVVRGQGGHVETSLQGAASKQLPASGCATIAGHPYVVRSFQRTGFAGEHLRIWVLV